MSTCVFDCQDAFPSNTCICNFSSGKNANGSGKLLEKADEKVWVVTRQGNPIVRISPTISVQYQYNINTISVQYQYNINTISVQYQYNINQTGDENEEKISIKGLIN